jgi:hypothetical protein
MNTYILMITYNADKDLQFISNIVLDVWKLFYKNIYIHIQNFT